ncbi:MAG TPA: DNA replication and repair protein RecF [Polyangiaceae bacterium]|nr:DNA replication and repair protein RecF [Polyangiaceae bacterium]
MASTLRFERLTIRGLRNLTALELEPAPRLNVIVGDNGQGKTSVLEGLYLVATTKSFRAERLATLIQAGTEHASVVARIGEDGLCREQRTVLGPRSRVVRLDGKAPKSLGAYATRTPVVVFSPADLELVSGGASGRRRLLDRVGLFVDPPGADARLRYEHAMRSRQRVLDERGPGARELDAFEEVMAEDGARFALARSRAAGGVGERLGATFARIAAPELGIRVTYVPGGTTDVSLFKSKLVEARPADTRRGAANYGPQRDELELELDGRPARSHASQGQQRLLTLALKLCELDCIREARGAHPVLLLDDVSSELDPERTLAVHELLMTTESQVFVTTTRADLFPERLAESADRADFRLASGALVEGRETP